MTDLTITRGRLLDDVDEQLFTRGVQATISVRGEVILDLTAGDDGLGRPMAPDTLLRIYCTIKPVTAVAVGLLLDAGRLDLDAPIDDVLSGYDALAGGASLRQVMTHTAGLQSPDGQTIELTPPDRRRTMLQHQKRPTGWQLGRDAAYSEHFGWHVVGRLIEEVTGEDLHDHLRRAVLDPLGMTETRIGMTHEEYDDALSRIGVNHDMRSLRSFPMLFERTRRVCQETNAAHGGYSTARDLDRFYQAVLRGLAGEDVPGLPTTSVLATLAADARPRVYDAVLLRECSYGLGFMTTLSDHHFGTEIGPRAFGHSGNIGSSYAFADPDLGLSAAIVFNGVVDPDSAFHRRRSLVRALYRDLEGPPIPEAVAPDEGRPRRRGFFRR